MLQSVLAPPAPYVPSPITSKARRLADSISRAANAISIAATEPTYTVGAGSANSTILTARSTTGALVLPMDTKITPIGCIQAYNTNGSPYAASTGYAAAQGSNGIFGRGPWGVAFGTNASAFDICVNSGGQKIRMRVNGRWCAEYLLSNDFSFRYIKVDFGTAISREIEIYFDYSQTWCGLNVAAGYSIWKTTPIPMNVALFGDSYIEAAYANGAGISALSTQVVYYLGLPVWTLGIGGQGVATAVNGSTFLDRINANDHLRFGQMDLIFVYNSVNDRSNTVATVQSNWQAILTKIKADQPNALIYGMTGFKTSGYAVDQAHNDAFVNAFAAVQDSSRMRCDDFNLLSPPLVSTTGNDKNDTIIIFSDGIHPSLSAGAEYMARRIVRDGILPWLNGLSA